MKIKRVKIKNFCQHSQRDDVFEAGVIGIVGPNGCGKSNYIKAIAKAITGSSGNPGKNEEDLQWGLDKGFVEVHFEADGTDGMVRRQLKSSSSIMKYGEDAYSTASKIDAVIYDILGLSAQVLKEMVFVNQGQIEGVLFQRPADRSKSFQALFGTAAAEKVREVLGGELKTLVVQSYGDALKRARAQLDAEVTPALKALRLRRQAVLRAELTEPTIKIHAELISEFDHQEKTAQQLAQANEVMLSHKPLVDAAAAAQAALVEPLRGHQQALEEVAPAVAAARLRVRDYESFQASNAIRTRLLEDKQKGIEVLAILAPLAPVQDKTLIAAREARVAFLREEVAISRKVVASFAEGEYKCPTCQQQVYGEFRVEHGDRLKEFEPELAALCTATDEHLARLLTHTNALSEWTVSRTYTQKQMVQIEEQLQTINNVEPCSLVQFTEDQAELAFFTTFTQHYEEGLRGLAVAKALLKERQSAYAAALSVVESLTSTESSVTLEERTAAAQAIASHQQAQVDLAQINGELTGLERRQQELHSQIKQYEECEAQQARTGQWRDVVEQARMVLHHKQLPSAVAQSYFTIINKRLSFYLDMFGAPFMAALNADNTVACTFGSRAVAAERLSGGQRVMLGIAFRFAVYDIFVGNMGMLMLDEPTVYLDDDNIEAVRQLLEKVKSYSKSAGLQLIIPTHEKRLISVFDQVISL